MKTALYLTALWVTAPIWFIPASLYCLITGMSFKKAAELAAQE